MTDDLFYWIGVVVFYTGGVLFSAIAVGVMAWAAVRILAKALNRTGALVRNLRDLKRWREAGMPRLPPL